MRFKMELVDVIDVSTLAYAFGYDSIPGFAFASDLINDFGPEEPWPYDYGCKPVDTYHLDACSER